MGVSMEFLIMSSSILSLTATGTAVRALWVVALALVVLWMVDRMKPSAPRRTIPVRVDHTKAPLHQETERPQKLRALAHLTGGSIVMGALVACIVGFILAIALEVVGGLLGN